VVHGQWRRVRVLRRRHMHARHVCPEWLLPLHAHPGVRRDDARCAGSRRAVRVPHVLRAEPADRPTGLCEYVA
jgi:hypothetical protein